MYFKDFPSIIYPFKDKNVRFKDIVRRVGVENNIAKLALYQKLSIVDYFITDGEKPEHVSMALYGTVDYYWTILVLNDIINLNTDWPKHQNTMFEYCEDKYGKNNATDTHHYIIADTENDDDPIVVDYDPAKWANSEILDVTNYEYESQLNDKKRMIKVLRKESVASFVDRYQELITG